MRRQLGILKDNCEVSVRVDINPLDTELNPICHLLALLGAHHILHISRIRVKGTGGAAVDCFYLAQDRDN